MGSAVEMMAMAVPLKKGPESPEISFHVVLTLNPFTIQAIRPGPFSVSDCALPFRSAANSAFGNNFRNL
jgi:hypothetical protein